MILCPDLEPLTFRKASRSGGNQTGPNCVEMAFAKASKSNPSGNCVEAAEAGPAAHHGCTPDTCLSPGILPGDVVVRDSKLGDDSPLIVFTEEQWAAYVARVVDGGLDFDGGDIVIRDPRPTGIVLRFTSGEWDAFADGCAQGEFDYGDQRANA